MIKVTIFEDQCKGCGLCVRACPKNVLEIAKSHLNAKGYYPAEVVRQEDCIACRLSPPSLALNHHTTNKIKGLLSLSR